MKKSYNNIQELQQQIEMLKSQQTILELRMRTNWMRIKDKFRPGVIAGRLITGGASKGIFTFLRKLI
jgi:hypothetical protein